MRYAFLFLSLYKDIFLLKREAQKSLKFLKNARNKPEAEERRRTKSRKQFVSWLVFVLM